MKDTKNIDREERTLMKQGSIFEDDNDKTRPLASRMRPQSLEEFIGQEHLLGKGKILRELIESDQVSSMIFWGPPGVGKTTLAKIIANKTKAEFITFSAVRSGIKEIRKVMDDSEYNRQFGEKTIVFVDEIHRFNKAQQDAFLPYVEKGSIIMIGATTENPSFEVNSALLSRSKVFVLNPLETKDIVKLLKNAIQKGFTEEVEISDDILMTISKFANGDARIALNTLEMCVLNAERDGKHVKVNEDVIKQLITRKALFYDKNGEEHYNIISALHKSMRNSDVHAAIYWLSRMLESGEDPLYIARRLVRFASEDIGVADSRALELSVSVFQACQFLGMPECDVHLTQAVIYLSLAPKSDSVYAAYKKAQKDALHSVNEPVPLQLRNAPTQLMKDLEYGKEYQHAQDFKDKITDMQSMPDSLIGREYYHPSDQGSEKRFKDRLASIKNWHSNRKKK